MTFRNDRLNAIAIAAAVICLLPLHLLTAGRYPAAAAGLAECGDSLSALQQLNGNIGMDAGMARRARSLTDAAGPETPPDPAQLERLAEDSMESLDLAADQMEQIAEQIGQRLQSPNLARQSRAWSRGVSDLRAARTNFRSIARRIPRQPNIGKLASGGHEQGQRVVYEAAATLEHSTGSLGRIAIDGGFEQMGMTGAIVSGGRDQAPPPNPLPDPWQEYLRRLRAQQALARNAASGVRAVQALEARQFAQARQSASDMQEALREATDAANELGRLLGPCAAPNQARSTSPRPPQSSTVPPSAPPPAAAAAASSGGGMGTATAALLGLAVAGGAGYYAYMQLNAASCGPEPQINSNYNACANGSCGACIAIWNELLPYCDCVEAKNPALTGGLCGQTRAVVENALDVLGCEPPAPASAAR